jgi:U3 small nucleolar RNA-associated protein 20
MPDLAPLSSTGEEDTQDGSPGELAKEVLELLEAKVGTPSFLKVYTAVQRAALQRRESRKRTRAAEAITDPEAAARRRLEKNAAKQQQRKRRGDQLRAKHGRVVKRRKETIL